MENNQDARASGQSSLQSDQGVESSRESSEVSISGSTNDMIEANKVDNCTLSSRIESTTNAAAICPVADPQPETYSMTLRRFTKLTASTRRELALTNLEPTSYEQFDQDHGYQLHEDQSIPKRVKLFFGTHRCSQNCVIKFLLRVFPFVKTLQNYNPRGDLLRDFIAGLTVCVMHIPQGMAYGLLAGLAPVNGLYSSLFPVAVYFFFGTSRHASFGTASVISLMVSNAITALLKPASLPSFITLLGAVANSTASTYVSSGTTMTSIATTTSKSSASSSSSCVSLSNEPLSETDLLQLDGQVIPMSELRLEIAIALTLFTGLLQVGFSILRLDFLTIYLSDSLISGFTTASAMYVATSQLSAIFGYSVPSYSGPLNLFYTYIALFSRIKKFSVISFGIAAGCAIILAVFKEKIQPLIKNRGFKFPIPVDLALIVIFTVISYFAQLKSHGVLVVGIVPPGIPAPRVPDVRYFGYIFQNAILIAVIGYTINYSMASLLARKNAYEVSGNQEMLASGLANTVSSFFNCHATTTSLSRSAVQEAAGGKTQITSLVSCAGIVLVLLFVAPLFTHVPRCVLSAIIIVALKNLFLQFNELPNLWRTSKYDFAIWIATFVATILLDVDIGFICGFVFSIFTIMLRTQAPHTCELGRVQHTTLYKNVHMYHDIITHRGIKVIRFDGALYFASKDHLRESVARRTGVNPEAELRRRKRLRQPVDARPESAQLESNPNGDQNNVNSDAVGIELENNIGKHGREYSTSLQKRRGSDESQVPLTHVILDCSSITFIDTAGIQALSQIVDEYAAIDVRVLLAGPHAYFRGMLEKVEFYKKHSRESVLVTTHDAVLTALKEQKVPPEEAVDFGIELAGVLREGCEADTLDSDVTIQNDGSSSSNDNDNATGMNSPGQIAYGSHRRNHGHNYFTSPRVRHEDVQALTNTKSGRRRSVSS